MVKTALTTAVLFSLMLSATTQAECNKPMPPNLPDPTQTLTPEMEKASNDVKAYMAAAKHYLACINDAIERDKMVTEMDAVAKHFDDVIALYNKRDHAAH